MFRLASRPDSRIEVLEAGLACCALEVEAAVARGFLVPADDAPGAPRVLVVAGTVTTALEPAIQTWYAAQSRRGPVRVVSFGACSTSGGPYWDAPTVRNGVDGVIPVDRYVPGCPPRPEALCAELERIIDEADNLGDDSGQSE